VSASRARVGGLLALAVVAVPFLIGVSASAATLPSGFQETVVLSGLTEPTAVRFSPDGRVFVIEKGGLVKVFDSLSDPTPDVYADLRTNVHSYDDRGMLGLALDPNFPAVPNIFVSYAHDAVIGGTAPRWGTPGANSDPCPTPPGPTLDGCVISSRLSRLSPASGGSGTYQDAVLADAPAAYWRLGEASGTTAADASGHGRTGSYVNTPSLGQVGALVGDSNTSVGFEGTSEHVTVPYTSALNTPSSSLEAWVYPTGGQGRFRAVVSNRDYLVGATRGSILYASASDTWQYWIGNGSGSWTVIGGPAVALNQWTHLVGTYDGTTARLYVNGALVSSVATAHTVNPSRPLRIAAGANERTADYLLPGRVDEVAVYSTALSAARVTAHRNAALNASQPSGVVETVLIEDWCQQFTTGSAGGIAFGPDGELYMTAGAGGSYHFIDYGQRGDPPNPCGDPPGGVGATLSPPTTEGGWLRSQDLRTSGDPVGLGGTLIRVDRTTGQAMPNNPLAANPDLNARRIVAYGLRNPFRIAVRPGTRDVWIGDVGAGTFEELNRVPDPTSAPVRNFGWPCYEGNLRSSGFDAADISICENLYAESGAMTLPHFFYQHGQKIVPTETCSTTTGSATSGLAFTPSNSTFPASYNGALFFADYSRKCIWVMYAGAGGIPDPATVTPFVQDASYPVDLQFGPDGSLYYVDVATGSVRRISYFAGNQPPVAAASATPTSGAVPLTVAFDGSGSSDPDGTITAYAWDLDGDGQYDDSTAQKPSFTYTTGGTYTVRLRVTDNQSAQDVSDPITITAGSSPPTAFIDTPLPSFTWRAGDVIAFSGHGTDPEDGTIPASRMQWDVTLQHCTSPGNCHTHFVQSFPGVASGSFSAPDHEYPSFLELKLTVTDSSGIASSKTIALNPRTVTLSLQSSPPGLSLVVNNNPAQTTPFQVTAVEGSLNSLSASSPQTLGGTVYAFSSWSDGGAQTHTVTANSSATYTATYTAQGGGGGYSTEVLADSPRAYWRLGEASGTTAADASGNGRVGSYLNTPTLGVAGALASDTNTAVGFNGTNEYVSVPYQAPLNPAQMTVEAWAYPTGGQGTNRSIVTSRDYSPGNARGYILYASSANTWQFWLGNGDWAVVYGPPIVLNQWTHLVGTYDGTTARLYVNGALAAFSNTGYLQNAVRPLRIASGATDKTNPQYYLPGRVDEVAVYGSALSAARVQAHFAASSSGGGNQPPNAVASAAPTSGQVPLAVAYNGSGSSDPDGSIAAYAWDLDGDGQYDDSTAQQPSFTYTTAGTYTVRLRVTDNQSAQDVSDPITITASGGSASYTSEVLADSPLAYWRLGEASGTTAADASGNGRVGSYLNTPTLGVAGALASDTNTAVGFNGTDEYVDVPYLAALNPAQMTVEAWAYPTGGQGTYRSIVTSRDYAPGNARGYILYASSANTWQLWLGNGDWTVVYGPPIVLNQWTHLVGTYDGTTARLYVNGALAAFSTTTYLQNALRPLRIASGATDKTSPQYYLPGRVDEVAVYGSALSATRVQAHFAASD
jgi:PKD repeat protein